MTVEMQAVAQSCSEQKACLALSLRRECGETTAELAHYRGPPLLLVAGEQGHGILRVRREPCSDLRWCGSEKEHGGGMKRYLRTSWPGSSQNRSTWAWVRHLGQNWTDGNCPRG